MSAMANVQHIDLIVIDPVEHAVVAHNQMADAEL